ncbi:hypothetical protein TNIN_175851 [Trichonephila inaurata madagascariensis]|uniref:Uncharacterized protein n=1 Tax=Trichonephila inaurata madagascariensis TaxID=2747483 RepID=A0A8X6M739_9ARAC|nr:hypothetical protein TNIN_175851 [Trichonephila inaurata madagascariensis]
MAGFLESYPVLLPRKRNSLELSPGNVVVTQCFLVFPFNDTGMPDPGSDRPPKKQEPRPVERTIPWSRAMLTVLATQLRSTCSTTVPSKKELYIYFWTTLFKQNLDYS